MQNLNKPFQTLQKGIGGHHGRRTTDHRHNWRPPRFRFPRRRASPLMGGALRHLWVTQQGLIFDWFLWLQRGGQLQKWAPSRPAGGRVGWGAACEAQHPIGAPQIGRQSGQGVLNKGVVAPRSCTGCVKSSKEAPTDHQRTNHHHYHHHRHHCKTLWKPHKTS